jgi:Ran-binding protein 3
VRISHHAIHSNISQLPATSAFANASSASPFATLQGIKPASGPETSKAAFEASSFSKLAKSSASPFGTLGTSLVGSGSFGTLAGKKSDAHEAPEKPKGVLGSAFGSAAKSPFASVSTGGGFGGAPSAFAKFGGGTTPSLFGSAAAGPGPSGGSKPPIVGLNSKPLRPFGAPDTDDEGNGPDSSGDEDDEGDDDDPQAKLAAALQDELKRDRRFHEHYGKTVECSRQFVADEAYSGNGRGARGHRLHSARQTLLIRE